MARTYWLCLIVFSALLCLGCATTRQQVKIGMVPRFMNPARAALFAAASLPIATPPAPLALDPATVLPSPAAGIERAVEDRSQVGTASYYHSFFEGRTTANGQTFSNRLLTAAHRTFEFGTRVRVTNLANLKSVVVTINDRGPYVSGRIIDLSRRAASSLGFVREGVAQVRVDPL